VNALGAGAVSTTAFAYMLEPCHLRLRDRQRPLRKRRSAVERHRSAALRAFRPGIPEGHL